MENNEWKKPALIVAGFLFFIWLIQLFQHFSGYDLGELGIFPREFSRLFGIITGPLIHGDFQHIMSNSIPLAISGFMIFYFYPTIAFRAFAMIYLLTGSFVWIFAKPAYHIGISGVVYGLVAFIFWNGIFRKNTKSLAIMTIIFTLYSGMFAGVFPIEVETIHKISWESHLIGALIGIFTSYYFKDELEEDEIKKVPIEEGKLPYFARDTFTKTKYERLLEAQQQQQQYWEEGNE
jgi:membrane associated rhomboid family serine protease